MKEIKDYLHLYLGCKCLVYGAQVPVILNGFDFKRGWGFINSGHNEYWASLENIKPILRPLSDMTEEERQESDLVRGDGDGCDNSAIPEAYEFKYLLSKHFDLFGLIESGLAIDKTKT